MFFVSKGSPFLLLFYSTVSGVVLLEAVKSLPVHHHSAGYILFPLGSLSHPGYFENRIPLKPALGAGWGWGCACSLANYSVAYEEAIKPSLRFS